MCVACFLCSWDTRYWVCPWSGLCSFWMERIQTSWFKAEWLWLGHKFRRMGRTLPRVHFLLKIQLSAHWVMYAKCVPVMYFNGFREAASDAELFRRVVDRNHIIIPPNANQYDWKLPLRNKVEALRLEQKFSFTPFAIVSCCHHEMIG
jgi:hypothetical protein